MYQYNMNFTKRGTHELFMAVGIVILPYVFEVVFLTLYFFSRNIWCQMKINHTAIMVVGSLKTGIKWSQLGLASTTFVDFESKWLTLILPASINFMAVCALTLGQMMKVFIGKVSYLWPTNEEIYHILNNSARFSTWKVDFMYYI